MIKCAFFHLYFCSLILKIHFLGQITEGLKALGKLDNLHSDSGMHKVKRKH